MDDHSIEEHYDHLAGSWHEFTAAPWKADVLWPAVESLLPGLDGARVLDAGCGNGDYAARLADRGASVLGVDASEGMIDAAQERHGDRDRLAFRRADLTEPLAELDALADDAFDLVCCQHVFSHLQSLETPLGSFARVLRPGGALVVSTHHPLHDYLVVRDREYPDTSDVDGVDVDPLVVPSTAKPRYHDTERFEIHWGGSDSENPGIYYRRSLSELLRPLLDAGFTLDEFVEPVPAGSFEREYPDLTAKVQRRPPRSLCFRGTLPA